jgi:hypothetical protein
VKAEAVGIEASAERGRITEKRSCQFPASARYANEILCQGPCEVKGAGQTRQARITEQEIGGSGCSECLRILLA